LPNIVVAVAPADTFYTHHDTLACIAPGGSVVISAHDSTISAGTGIIPSYLWNDGVTTTKNLTVTAPGTYWVTIYNGCSLVVDTINVSMLAPYSGARDTSLCGGDTVTISFSIPGGLWTSSNSSIATVDSLSGLVTALSAGVDTITYSAMGLCGIFTGSEIVTVNPLPYAGYISGPENVCIGIDSVRLIDTAAGGTWSSSNSHASVSGGVVHGISLGLDTIYYVVSNVCGSDTARHIISVSNCPSGLANFYTNEQGELRIYPNPGNGTFAFSLSSPFNEILRVDVVSAVGEKVKELTTLTNTITNVKLDVPAGVYFLSAGTEHGRWNERIVVVK
jgi:hypothetical protein